MHYIANTAYVLHHIISQLTIRHFYHYIAWKIVLFTHYLFTILYFIYFFHWQENLLYDIVPAIARNVLVEILLHLSFFATYHSQHIPLRFGLLYFCYCIFHKSPHLLKKRIN